MSNLPPNYLSPHFTKFEFACRHCGELPRDGISQMLLEGLELIRAHYGVPVNINSGYRCPIHNANVGGASNSRHMYGDAADFTVKGISPHDVYALCDPLHLTGGLGRYNTFTHIDFRGHRVRW